MGVISELYNEYIMNIEKDIEITKESKNKNEENKCPCDYGICDECNKEL